MMKGINQMRRKEVIEDEEGGKEHRKGRYQDVLVCVVGQDRIEQGLEGVGGGGEEGG